MNKTSEAAYRKQERQYQVDNAMSTLKKAAEIKKDPALMRDVQKAIKQLQASCVGRPTPPPRKKK
jgi:hypothetical protein